MSNFTKIIFLFLVLLIFCFNLVYATNITETEISEDASTIVSDTQIETEEEIIQEKPSSSSFNLNNSGVTSVTTLSSYSEANLELNNILNILLIAIVVLMSLFAIAILIRLKH